MRAVACRYEPTSMRAIRARYNPYVQARARVDQLRRLGHSVDKVRRAARAPGCPGRCHAWTPSFTPAVTHQGAPGADHPASI